MSGTLILCATPIGNLGDLSERAVAALANADVIFAEDTRRTAKLLNHIGASVPMKSFFAHNERSRLEELSGHLEHGETVVLVSDAGMPVVSDPGMSAVDAAIDAGAKVTAIPGPSAVVTALAVSGFDGDRFVFEGFLPRKGRARAAGIESMADEQRTVVFFAAPGRVAKDLAQMAEVMSGERRIVLARELTKLHEEIWRGTITEAVDHWSTIETIRGEFTVVVEGAAIEAPDIESAVDAVKRLVEQGSTTSDAVRDVATSSGVSRRELYDLVVKDRS
ncbi:MAG: 16S rRNA (cytidine(1402)-2'-O)-methyltransferase [Actinomycetota bacterium]